MWKEIQKRPFSRPLFLWIAGILFATCLPGRIAGMISLCIPLLALFLSFALVRKGQGEVSYGYRWVWGGIFSVLFVSLAIGWTYRAERQAERNMQKVSEATSLAAQSRRFQQVLVEDLDRLRLTDEEKSVLATLTIGYRQVMNRDVKQRFSATGVSHILAVSGLHVGIVCGFLFLLLQPLSRRSLGRKIRYLAATVLVWGYVWMTGMAPSAIRAGIMLSVYLIGQVLRRPTDRYNTVAAAAFCMLVYDPFYLFDIGFQLSFLAVFFILFFQPRLEQWMVVKNPLLAVPWTWITVSLAAQMGTSFLCLYYFQRFSWVFLLTNLPLTVLATVLIPAGLLWFLLPDWLLGYGYLQYAVEGLTRSLLGIVDAFARIPGVSYVGHWSGGSAILAYGVLFFAMLYVSERRPWQLITALGGVLIILILRLIERFILFRI